MALFLDDNEITSAHDITYNGTDLTRVVCNNKLVWEKNPLFGGLCITALDTGTQIAFSAQGSFPWTAEYKINSGEWTTYTLDTILTLTANDQVYFKGAYTQAPDESNYLFFSIPAGRARASGNIMSICSGTNYATVTTLPYDYCFFKLFASCYQLQSSPTLPATTLTAHCYEQMFFDCTWLSIAPNLPALVMKNSCYKEMFSNCRALIALPDLPSVDLEDYCYAYMFKDCIRIGAPAVLKATTIPNYAYTGMFSGCTSIKIGTSGTDIWRIPAEGEGTMGTDALLDMLTNTGGSFAGTPYINANYYYESYTAPLKITAEPNYLVTVTIYENKSSSDPTDPLWVGQYSSDNDTWYNYTIGTVLRVEPEQTIYLRGSYQRSPTLSNYIRFSVGGKFSISGEMESFTGSNLPDTYAYRFQDMFFYCSQMLDASGLILPTKMLPYDCYGMFFGCSSLTATPQLPATELAERCYDSMFSYCSSLEVEPDLPANELAPNCYRYMFSSCTSLTKSPTLDARSLATGCYAHMFEGCTGLISAVDLPAVATEPYCYEAMFSGCSALVDIGEIAAVDIENYTCHNMFYNCTSLETAPNLGALTVGDYGYQGMFKGCTALTTAMAELPASDLSNATAQYQGMFSGCTALTATPSLPAVDLSQSCYESMFNGCTSLVMVSELPALSLQNMCYQRMFAGCTSLNMVPQLQGTIPTYIAYSYYSMFEGCTSLTLVPKLPSKTGGSQVYGRMFNGCTSLYISDEEVSGTAEVVWQVPYDTTTTYSFSSTEVFTGCQGTRVSNNLEINRDSSVSYYTQYNPV